MRTPTLRVVIVALALAVSVTGCAAQNRNDEMSEKLDNMDWHVESATEQGLSEYAGGAHIAYFLAWAFERELLDPDATDDELAVAVQEQEPSAFEQLLDWFDGVLTTDALNAEGSTFASECYASYLEEYSRLTGERQYHEPDWSVYEPVREVLDELRQHGCA